MAEDEAAAPPAPVIKKVKKRRHEGHHGGAWKVAYADFVTAMMAFFLLLWLVNATSEEEKRGIADYFSPTPGTVKSTSGGSGLFRGDTVASEGLMVEPTAPPTMATPVPSQRYEDGTQDEGPDFGNPGENTEGADVAETPGPMDEEEAERLLAEIEERQFAEAEAALRQAIQDVPELRQLSESLLIDRTPEGLRIQIVDQEKYAMFPKGSAEMHEWAHKLMALVAKVISKMPQKVSITGHTDATPYLNPQGYDNWDLSTDRANASRRALIDRGLPPERIVHMTGKADQDPLFPDDPYSPRNRRISIVLLREQGLAR